MDTKVYKVHINCSPWREDGKWHLIRESDYKFEEHRQSTTSFDGLQNWLEDLLDAGEIHSYYIEGPGDEAPAFHVEG